MEAEDLTVGVVGAGTMGAGIAQVATQAGHAVVLYDIDDSAVGRGLDALSRFIRRGAEKGRYSADVAEAAVARVRPTTDLADMAGCGLVVEAAPETLALKQDIFRQLDEITRPEALLATNTSTLSVAAIASATERPAQVCGMHFFNPAPLMPLVEVVRGPATAPETIAAVVALARQWGKQPVEATDTPGFIVNRVARPFYGEALRLLGEGAADVEVIDRLARDAGFPMGPFELMDLIGIDVNLAAAQSVFDGFFGDPRFRPHPIQRSMVEAGRLGRKTGQGYYPYPADQDDG